MAPSTPPDRDSSPELGSPSLLPQYNKKTGRPIRRSAGKIKMIADYVDSAIIEDDEPSEVPSEDEDEVAKPSRKRKRTPSPPPPPLDPIIYDEEPDEASDEEDVGNFHHNVEKPPTITLQFNVPLGFHGPLVVKLDRSLLQDNTEGTTQELQPRRTKRKLNKPTPVPQSQGTAAQEQKKTGFCDLPGELRNKVYRLAFVTSETLAFPDADNLCRSGQFLSTCKMVYGEGCSILYGENKFSFERNKNTRRPFWEKIPREIGYTDVRRFLKAIGPENLAYLRDIRLVFDDATQSSTSYLTHEERRFLNDEHLFDCLRILREAKLRKLTLRFDGRRTLHKTDVRFLGYLEQVKADEIVREKEKSTGWSAHPPGKLGYRVWEDLKESMTRKKKLYAEEKGAKA
ncbi:hypothetical protein BU26DRAFT_201519 [Trematosphaeria pertusa]|uniref:Uncharacterized protein n=1 Tax=Trematosphaeria pertusa TaxID=390896 RepID=A0A6A6HSU4_9PLEO|nr:uncharacterized protein BU26DRAFT_201519 [Trematosphaeria pertusa]KAF2240872.1 hypothetical protein BU26DRAFT_201519 [Trematosphaeria pertusa]